MIRALIIDDEERARRTLQSIVNNYCDGVEIIDSCSTVPEGVISINKNKPDLIFLDVEMPEYNGFDLFSFFQTINFEIIFITAYNEFAIKAFEVSAVDYLLKPVEIDLLQKAIKKVQEKAKSHYIEKRFSLLKDTISEDLITKVALPVGDGLEFIEIAQIVLLEADGSYTTIYLKNGNKMVVSKKLKFFENILEYRPNIYRTHRSYLINLNFIKKYQKRDGTIIMENKLIVPVARDKKSDFELYLKQLKYTS